MSAEPEPAAEGGLLAHLAELRNRLLYCVLALCAAVLALLPWRNTLYSWLAEPLLKHLPEHGALVSISVVGPFLIPFKLVLLAALVLTAPFMLYHLWAFVAPGLYRHERRLVAPLLVSSTVLFYLGMAFAYFLVFPLVFGFIMGMAPEGVTVTPDIGSYLDTVVTLFSAFGLAFEIPVALVLLVHTGVVEPETLAEKRPHVIVAAFVLGMLLTPPDVVSQVLLALPMWWLYELGLLVARLLRRRAAAGSPGDGAA